MTLFHKRIGKEMYKGTDIPWFNKTSMTYTYDKQVLTSLVLTSVYLGVPEDKTRDTVWQYIFHISATESFHTLWYD